MPDNGLRIAYEWNDAERGEINIERMHRLRYEHRRQFWQRDIDDCYAVLLLTYDQFKTLMGDPQIRLLAPDPYGRPTEILGFKIGLLP